MAKAITKTVDQMTDKELKAEILRRKAGEIPADNPTPLAKPNFAALIAVCEQHKNDLMEKGYSDGDYKNEIYNLAMAAIYGEYLFEWKAKVVNFHTSTRLAAAELADEDGE